MLTSINDCSGTINRTTTVKNAITRIYTDHNNSSSSQTQTVIVSYEKNGITELSILILMSIQIQQMVG
jgi:hypothetical protein